jgi:hypothetical protein
MVCVFVYIYIKKEKQKLFNEVIYSMITNGLYEHTQMFKEKRLMAFL